MGDVLKLDVEGYEALVFEGSMKLLRGNLGVGRPSMILFEYSAAWVHAADPSTHCLKTVTSDLASVGYQSFLVGDEALVRVDQDCWHPSFEFWWWSNVVAFVPQRVDVDAAKHLYSRIRAREKW